MFCHGLSQGGNDIAPHHDIFLHFRIPQVQVPVLQPDALVRFAAAVDLERQLIIPAFSQYLHAVRYHFNIPGRHFRILAAPLPDRPCHRNDTFFIQGKENIQDLLVFSYQLCGSVKVPQDHKGQISAYFPDILNPSAEAHGLSCILQPELITGMCSVLHHHSFLSCPIMARTFSQASLTETTASSPFAMFLIFTLPAAASSSPITAVSGAPVLLAYLN